MILGKDESEMVFFTAFSTQAEEKLLVVATELGKDFKDTSKSISGAANSISGVANEMRDMFFIFKWTTIICVATAVPFGMYWVLSSSRTNR